ncbi:hypothetical protein [Cuniculiplasma divulgatum]|jgi:hypothetical protein|uniref:Uncharacterized protein n=1 Tax=Cuniculiplasma divulgatum TaxID=1673428 RepID=A0A1N5WC52_9ARCH|nr:hypothetical protein [Cuniculiplasma divulgatum]EQB67933.1 MAG: hypothetical protein AMDU5_GPLC00019G0019 [Thermoplasmatales archaeon Gpl]WMT49865.1 MAG: hypothetical protein RE472_02590 [Thermoplasmatales archaeon]SIM82818.1 hypothetical protein CSP5_1758 [Cuniculiplasma divulgatum]
MYRGSLTIIVYNSFSEIAQGQILEKFEGVDSLNLLITDGIMLSPSFLSHLSVRNVKIQRILTSHQLIRVMGEQETTACAMVLNSRAVEDWDSESVSYMMDAMAVWPITRGLFAFVEFIGKPPISVRTNHLMKRAFYMPDTGGDEKWAETRTRQGRLWKVLQRQ